MVAQLARLTTEQSPFLGEELGRFKYYISQDSSDELCTEMQRWADDNDFSESTVRDDQSCAFAGVIDGDNVRIQVAPPRDEIVPRYRARADPDRRRTWSNRHGQYALTTGPTLSVADLPRRSDFVEATTPSKGRNGDALVASQLIITGGRRDARTRLR